MPATTMGSRLHLAASDLEQTVIRRARPAASRSSIDKASAMLATLTPPISMAMTARYSGHAPTWNEVVFRGDPASGEFSRGDQHR